MFRYPPCKPHSGGGPIHAHPQFSQRFELFHGKDVYHIIDNYQIDHVHR